MREEKRLLLDEVKEKIEGAKGFVTLNYQNFTAAKIREFRDTVAQMGGEFEVVKKRVFLKAAELAGIHINESSLSGHVGIVFAYEDEARLVKGAVKFGEAHENTLTVLGGHLEGVHCTAEDVEAMAKLPALPQMRAQLLGLFEAPLSQTLQVFQALLCSVLYGIDEREKKS